MHIFDSGFPQAPDQRTRSRILSDNPAELYGFGPSTQTKGKSDGGN
jgi:hypothetical protein